MKPEDSFPREERCPNREELAAFARALLPSQKMEAIADHVEQCPKCESAVEALMLVDPLLADLRRTPPDDAFSDEPERAVMEAGVQAIQAQAPSPAPASSSALLPRIPGFEIKRRIATGVSSLVLLAEQEAPRRTVALKVLPDVAGITVKRCKRFLRDVAAVAQIPGSRVLPVFEILHVDRSIVLVMPYVDGIDLGVIVKGRRAARHGAIAAGSHRWLGLDDRQYLADVLPVLGQVIETMAQIHEFGGLCRELKPANCLVDRQGNVWLTDFALSRLLGRGVNIRLNDPDSSQRTELGFAGLDITLGAPGFISPEEWSGQRGDHRTDVFALGVLLYQALTLDLPYGTSPLSSRKPSPQPLSARQPLLSPAFDPIIAKALHLDPDQRYPSAVHLRNDWRLAQATHRPEPRPPSWLSRILHRFRW
jgi:eukaryotic-like serine/threonine-protein kinase